VTEVRQVVSLPPSTVTKAERLTHEQRRARISAGMRRAHAERGNRVNGPVTSNVIEQEVWHTALRLAHGILTRIERVSPTEVIVHNNPR